MRDSPVLLRRMLALRQFPLFGQGELGELATVAENLVERAFVAGDIVAPADRLSSLHLVVGGALEVGGARIEPRQVHGALEIAADRAARAPAIAIAPTRTLVLDASDYFEVLEDNFRLLLATIRELAARVIPIGAPRRSPVAFGAGALGLVERMILLRQLAPFEAAGLEALAILAHAATESFWPAGAIVRRAAAPVESALVVVEGVLRGEHEHGPGHALGLHELLAGLHHGTTLEAVTPVRALVTHSRTILDVLEDHTDFAIAMMQNFARTVLDHADPRNGCADSPAHSWRAS